MKHPHARRHAWRPHASPPSPSNVSKTLPELLALHERLIIIKSLGQNGYSRQKTAKQLGISRNYLWRRMTILGIDFSVLPRTTAGRPRKKYT